MKWEEAAEGKNEVAGHDCYLVLSPLSIVYYSFSLTSVKAGCPVDTVALTIRRSLVALLDYIINESLNH